MPRRHPARRGIRPGRRPPRRFVGDAAPRPRGFSGLGFGPLFLMTGLRGRDKKEYCNMLSGCVALGLGLGAAVTGAAVAGPLGAIAGLVGGVIAGAASLEKGRFFRR